MLPPLATGRLLHRGEYRALLRFLDGAFLRRRPR